MKGCPRCEVETDMERAKRTTWSAPDKTSNHKWGTYLMRVFGRPSHMGLAWIGR